NDKDGDPKPTATADPSENDEPATTEYIAKIGGIEIYASEFKYFLYDALKEVDYTDLDIPDDASEKETYELMLAFLNEKDENGVSRLDKAVERAVELCALFKIAYLEGVKAGFELSDEEKQEQYDSINEFVNYYLSVYGEEYDAKTRDDMMRIMYSMNVNDYKRLAVQQVCANKYAKDVMEGIKPSDEELVKFYEENEETYRVVTVRHILISTLDEDGEPLDEEEKAKKLERAERVKRLVESGEHEIDALVKGYSDDTDLSNLGLYDVSKNSNFVKEFKEWALKQTEVTDVVEIIETQYGYHVMMCEEIKTIENEAVKKTVLEGYKNDTFDKQTKQLLADKTYELTERNDDIIKKSVEDYITIMFNTDEDDDK
ncbi:MAG: hypothetical protein GX166_08305, partial [Clostridiaceae bacterium]|nr:hypothetical protein [Clostridiaceae bacterium]